MSRIHDMGGRYGDGPVPETDDNVVFHSNWEARAMAITVACGSLGAWNIDAGRHARECLRPSDYASFTYYEKWVSALADILVAREVLSVEDIKNASGGSAPQSKKPSLAAAALRAKDVIAAQRKVTPYTRPHNLTQQFQIGDLVRTVSDNPNAHKAGGHTRLPAYAMGRVGKVVILHGSHVLPDSNAHFAGEAPEPLYAVEFEARVLWGRNAENPEDKIVLDLWQNYLSKVGT